MDGTKQMKEKKNIEFSSDNKRTEEEMNRRCRCGQMSWTYVLYRLGRDLPYLWNLCLSQCTISDYHFQSILLSSPSSSNNQQNNDGHEYEEKEEEEEMIIKEPLFQSLRYFFLSFTNVTNNVLPSLLSVFVSTSSNTQSILSPSSSVYQRSFQNLNQLLSNTDEKKDKEREKEEKEIERENKDNFCVEFVELPLVSYSSSSSSNNSSSPSNNNNLDDAEKILKKFEGSNDEREREGFSPLIINLYATAASSICPRFTRQIFISRPTISSSSNDELYKRVFIFQSDPIRTNDFSLLKEIPCLSKKILSLNELPPLSNLQYCAM